MHSPSPSPSPDSANNTQPPLPEGPLPLKTLSTPLQQGSSNQQCRPKPTVPASGDVLDLIRAIAKPVLTYPNFQTYVDDDLHGDMDGHTSPSTAARHVVDVEMDGCIHTEQAALPEKFSQLGAKLLVSAGVPGGGKGRLGGGWGAGGLDLTVWA
jgi:hypothetical protein